MQPLWLISTLRFSLFLKKKFSPSINQKVLHFIRNSECLSSVHLKRSWQIFLATTPQEPIDGLEKSGPEGHVQHMQPPPPYQSVCE